MPIRPSRPEPKSQTAAGTGTAEVTTVIEYDEPVLFADNVQVAAVGSYELPVSRPLPLRFNTLAD